LNNAFNLSIGFGGVALLLPSAGARKQPVTQTRRFTWQTRFTFLSL